MTTNSVDTCQCQAATHGHQPNKCKNPATGPDNLCKPCHGKAAVEASDAIRSLSEPVRRAATTVGTGGATGVGAWLTPLPPDHPFYALVGRVASEWSHLEHILDLTIWDLARWKTEGFTDEIAACLTAQIGGIPGRCNAIESLGILRGLDDATIIKPVRKLRQEAHSPADNRARMIYDAWFIEEPSKKPGAFRAMPNSDRRFGVQEIPERTFENLLEQIAELQKRANEIRNAISNALHNKQT